MSVEVYNSSLNEFLHSVREDIYGDYKIGTKSGQPSNLRQNLTPTLPPVLLYITPGEDV